MTKHLVGIQYPKLTAAIFVGILLLVPGTAIAAEKLKAPLYGGAGVLQHDAYSWEALEAKGRTVSQARRLSGNFSLQEEFSPDGRLLARLRKDGSRESVHYGKRRGMIFVWVTDGDGKFKEERLYVDNLLRAVLYVDGSLKTLQHLAPIRLHDPAAKDNRECALCVVLSSGKKTKILKYNQLGKLISVYLPDGKELMIQTQAFTEDLSQVVNIEDLEIKQKR